MNDLLVTNIFQANWCKIKLLSSLLEVVSCSPRRIPLVLNNLFKLCCGFNLIVDWINIEIHKNGCLTNNNDFAVFLVFANFFSLLWQIAFWAFPQDEGHVNVFSQLTLQGAHEWNYGGKTFNEGRIKKIRQVGEQKF